MREERGGVFAAAFVMRTHDGLADGLSDAQRSIQGRIADFPRTIDGLYADLRRTSDGRATDGGRGATATDF